MEICSGYCDFAYDESKRTFVCRKCGYALTDEDKRRILAESWRKLQEEEANEGIH